MPAMDDDGSAKTSKGRDGYLVAIGVFTGGAVVLAGVLGSVWNGVIPSRWHHEPLTRESNPVGFWLEVVVGFGIAGAMLCVGGMMAIERRERGRKQKG
jgi:hypothetical protein